MKPFADRLREAGFRSRYQVVEIPLTRADDEDDEDNDLEFEEDGLTLRGLAVPFNSPTRIDNWFEGTFDEQFAPGAFKRTIGQDHQLMQYEHGYHALFGSLPIADIKRLEETDRGLEVTARMFDNWLTEPLRDALGAQAIRGMSIRFRPIQELVQEREDDVPLVTITEADLRELGPVPFPAYEDTEVELRYLEQSVRRGFEEALRRGGGSPDGRANNEPTDPGSTHSVHRNRLARAKLTTLEMQL